MREILCRGLTIWKSSGNVFNHVWVSGDLITSNGKYYIHPQNNKVRVDNELGKLIIMHEVDPETVGQYTGLTDNNGKKIFEGDILETAIGVGYVVYGTACFSMQDIHSQNRPALDIVEDASGLEIEVIGNIFDNPELLE